MNLNDCNDIMILLNEGINLNDDPTYKPSRVNFNNIYFFTSENN